MNLPETIVSHQHFEWFLSALIAIPSLSWLIVDTMRLRRALTDRRRVRAEGNPSPGSLGVIHDRIFGSVIGLLVAALGVAGVIVFNLKT